MGILVFIFRNKKKKREQLRLEEEARKKEIEEERFRHEKEQSIASARNDINKQLWEQFERVTNRRVVTTGHLLFLKQLIGDSLFAYKHISDTSEYPSYMWADKKLFLGDDSKVAYTVPFLWIRSIAKNNVQKFNDTMDLLNNEYQINVDSYDVEAILNNIKSNGFYQFRPNFDVNINKALLIKFCKDSACLLRLINFFGDNINMVDLLPSQTNEVYIQSTSHQINEVINEMVDAFRKGNLS